MLLALRSPTWGTGAAVLDGSIDVSGHLRNQAKLPTARNGAETLSASRDCKRDKPARKWGVRARLSNNA
ncbi:hypothetical protein GCM10010836_31020 [Aminobacter aminovorans]